MFGDIALPCLLSGWDEDTGSRSAWLRDYLLGCNLFVDILHFTHVNRHVFFSNTFIDNPCVWVYVLWPLACNVVITVLGMSRTCAHAKGTRGQ